MIDAVARLVLAAVLMVAAALKLAAPRSSQAALATFGVRREAARWPAWAAIVAAELGLAAGVALGSAAAAYMAAGMLVAFSVALGVALARGRSGAPCACFGSRSRVGPISIVRNLVLAAAFAAAPSLPGERPTTDELLALGLAVALIVAFGLGVAVLALAREVGVLRLQIAPQAALEIPGEGPDLGARTDLAPRFDPKPSARFLLAVFSSEGCRMCRGLAPAVAALGRDPLVAVEVFDERRDVEAWRLLRVPGAPFAVVLDLEGAVLAKGTFNTLGQLEGLLAGAERRVREGVPG